MTNNKIKNIASWTLQILLGLIFLGVGLLKFTGPEAAQAFGFPTWSWMAIGTIEVIGGILLVIPKTTRYAALILSGLMAGATGTHIVTGFLSTIMLPVILLLLLVIVFLLRKPMVSGTGVH